MATNSSWCLERLGEQNTMHILKIGETKIGRRKNSDIKVASLICSRWHCSITVDADNKVSVEDRSNNGIFVNQARTRYCELHQGDVLGLACDQSVFQLDIPNINEFYVYKLYKITHLSSASKENATSNDPESNQSMCAINLTQDEHFNLSKIIEKIPLATNKTIQAQYNECDPSSSHISTKPSGSKTEKLLSKDDHNDPKVNQPTTPSSPNIGKTLFRSSESTPSIPMKRARSNSVYHLPVTPSSSRNDIQHVPVDRMAEQKAKLNNDPIHNIINDITEWNPSWFFEKDSQPPVNGDNVTIPLANDYENSVVYRNTIIPLLKYELWASILYKNEKYHRTPFNIMVNDTYLEMKGDRQRYIIRCKDNVKAMDIGDFVLVEARECPIFFAYVTYHRIKDSMHDFCIEASKNVVHRLLKPTEILGITPIAHIRNDLKPFSAVFQLKYTPFNDIILKPTSFQQTFGKMINNFDYKGYDDLDEVQLAIVESIFNKYFSEKAYLSIIEGPPGSGKTRLIVSMILQFVFGEGMPKSRILVLAPSKAAIDVIVKKLIYIREKLSTTDESKASYLNFVRFDSGYLSEIGDKLATASIICTTLLDSINLRTLVRQFHICLIDDASQCTEPWTLFPLLYGMRSFILVGDSNQSAECVRSPCCRENGMERSLFERLYSFRMNRNWNSNVYSLQTQYRMHPQIWHFLNENVYKSVSKSEFKSDPAFKLNAYNLFDLNVKQSILKQWNTFEAEFVVDLLKVFVIHASPTKYSYGIITPFIEQRDEIQKCIAGTVQLTPFEFTVNVIDSFRGLEKDIIIVSPVKPTGFSSQQFNFALSRAKRCLTICGTFDAYSRFQMWRKLVNDAGCRKVCHKFPMEYTLEMIKEKVELIG